MQYSDSMTCYSKSDLQSYLFGATTFVAVIQVLNIGVILSHKLLSAHSVYKFRLTDAMVPSTYLIEFVISSSLYCRLLFATLPFLNKIETSYIYC